MSKLFIAIDMDDVVVDFTGMVVDVVNRDYGVALSREDVRSWEFGQYGLNEALGEDWWEWVQRHAWLWATKAKPVPGALGGIEKLRAAGHELEILTSKPEWAEWVVWYWFGKYRPPVQRVTIIPLKRDPKSGFGMDKASASSADILIDDRDKNVFEWVNSDPSRFGILFRAPWNDATDLIGTERIVRAQDWGEVLRTIALLEDEL